MENNLLNVSQEANNQNLDNQEVDNQNNGNQDSNNSNDNNTDNSQEYPEGFDAETYDLATNSIKADKVKERFDLSKKEIEKLNKQVLDFRKVISKGKAPEDIKDYESSYKPDSKFEKYYTGDDTTKETINSFNELAKNTGLNLDQHKAVLDFFNDTMVNLKVFDTRSENEIKIQQEDWIKAEKVKLGKEADNIIKDSLEFTNNFGMFNEEQKEALKGLMSSGAVGVSIVNTIKNIIQGNNGQKVKIPMDVKVGDIADDYTLASEYYNSNTTEARRKQIMQDRIKADRTGFLPTC